MSSIFSSFFHLQFLLRLCLYSMQPIILRPVALVKDSGVRLPSPGALENPAGMSRTLSSLAVTGESDPAAIPSNSGSLSWGIECSASAGSMSMGWDLSRMLSMADANSASVVGVPGLVDVGDVLDAQLLIKGLFLTVFWGGVWYLDTASCSSSVPCWRRVNPGGTLSASVGCRASRSWSFPVMPAHDGVVKHRSLVSCTPSQRYVSHRSSTAVSSGFCRSDVGPGSVWKRSLSGGPK